MIMNKILNTSFLDPYEFMKNSYVLNLTLDANISNPFHIHFYVLTY